MIGHFGKMDPENHALHLDFVETTKRATEKNKAKALCFLPSGTKCVFIKRTIFKSYYEVSLPNGIVISRDRYPHMAWGKAYSWAIEFDVSKEGVNPFYLKIKK